MACSGLKPVVAIYSTFLQRAYDQFVHDVVVQGLDVTFAIDRAGVVGADGSTHTGNFDVAYSRCIPDVILMAPSNGEEMFKLLNTAYQYPGPAMVRYPRDSVVQPGTVNIDECVDIGKAVQTRSGKQTALLVFGSLYSLAEPIADELDLSLVDMRFIKPLDESLIKTLAQQHDYLVTLEDASIIGGAGTAVLEFLGDNGITTPLLRLGLADSFPSQGSREQVLQDYGLDPESIRKSIVDFTQN
jgi:1-deoxy-D-xylulose-5-phosphate synthase